MNPWLHRQFECKVDYRKKKQSLVATFRKELNCFLLRPKCNKDSSDVVSVIIWVVSDRGTLMNRDSTSKLAIVVESSMLSCLISFTNSKVLAVVYSLVVRGSMVLTRNLAML